MLSAVAVAALVFTLYMLWQRNGLGVVALLATLGAQYEFIKLCFPSAKRTLKASFFIFTFLIFLSFANKQFEVSAALIAFGLMFLSTLVMLMARKDEDNLAKQSLIATCMMGFIYVGILPGITAQLILWHPLGLEIFFICIATVIATDVMAYFIGRKFGKIKLLPTISPNKTRLGSIAGCISALVTTFSVSWLLGLQDHILGLTLAGLIASVFSQFGDLFESVLKRNAGKKDSGRIMPGHGGYLDRLDSILFSFPVFYCYVTWFI